MTTRLIIASKCLSSLLAGRLSLEITEDQVEKAARLALKCADSLIAESERSNEPIVNEANGYPPLEIIKKNAILRTLKACNWNREKAAEILKIGERTLYRKLKQYSENGFFLPQTVLAQPQWQFQNANFANKDINLVR